MLSLVATQLRESSWDAPHVLLVSSSWAWPLFDELQAHLGQCPSVSSWLLARLWLLTNGAVGVENDTERWADGAVLELDFLLLGAHRKPVAHVVFELDTHWFGTTLTWSVPEDTPVAELDEPEPPDEIVRLCAQTSASLTRELDALAACRVLVCDYERCTLPWVCGWDGKRLGSVDRYAYDTSAPLRVKREQERED